MFRQKLESQLIVLVGILGKTSVLKVTFNAVVLSVVPSCGEGVDLALVSFQVAGVLAQLEVDVLAALEGVDIVLPTHVIELVNLVVERGVFVV